MLFQEGEFRSHSGLILPDKIDCDALTEKDWQSVAAWFARRIAFQKAVGVPRGGLRLASALAPYATSGPVLIVDDVLTTGGSMEKARLESPGAIGAVLFARTREVPDWILARFVEAP